MPDEQVSTPDMQEYGYSYDGMFPVTREPVSYTHLDLYAKLYEDVSKGLLPEKRFQMLADRYDKEQAELTEKIEQYEREGRAEHDQLDKIQDFIDEDVYKRQGRALPDGAQFWQAGFRCPLGAGALHSRRSCGLRSGTGQR